MKNTVLDFKTLSSLEQEQYPIGEIILNVGEYSFPVKYQEKFRDSKIQELIKEWLLIKERTEQDKIEANMYDISFILVLKHFTDVPYDEIEDITERLAHYVKATNVLADVKDVDGVSLYEKIFSCIDKTQLEKISTAMRNVSEAMLQETRKLQESAEYKKLRDFVEESEA